MTIWEFALTFYAQDGVEADCLAAQDQHGLDVTALIFALNCARERQAFDAGQSAALAASFSARVVEPLRRVRVALKASNQFSDAASSEALREKIKLCELEAEKLVLETLVALPHEGKVLRAHAALLAIVAASQVIVNEDLAALLKRLALASETM
jgi:uncharacterized protein (TIGR02444 family)